MARETDLHALKSALADRAEELCVDLFGAPTRKARHEWRWGNKGSLKLRLRGKTFYDFSAGRGGSMLDAIALALDHHRLADSIAYAKQWLGLAAAERRKTEPRRNDAFDLDAEGERHARAIWDASRPITGTRAETYLRGRGIEAETWPTSVRWNAGTGCVVFASTSPDNRITAIQRVFLHPDGKPVTEDDGKGGRRKIKRSRGPRYGGAVHFKGYHRPDVLILAEGPETALSIWHASGIETWATIGPVHTVDLTPVPKDRTILVALDDDPRNAQVRKHTTRAIMRWRAEGRTVLTALPWPSTRRDKSDFNDALKERGATYVAETIEAALTPKQNNVRTLTISEARTATTTAMDKAITELLAPPEIGSIKATAIALKISTGIGKTEAALRIIIWAMISGRLRAATFAVPDNMLSAELLGRAVAIRDELGGTFEIGTWRGREADNPEAMNEKMCRRPDVVRAVQRAGLDVQTFACRTREGAECPFYKTCAYQAQRRQKRRLTITNHAAVFAKKPAGIPTPDLLVLDESFWSQGLIGTGTKIITPHDELTDTIRLTHEHGRDLFGDIQARAEADALADIEPVREKLRAILTTAPEGPLRREHIEGLTADACRAAAKAEGRRLVVPRITPAMPGAEIMRRLEKASGNAGCRRRAALLDAIADFIESEATASGHILIDRTEDGTPVFRSLGRRPLGDGWAGAPALILDATLRLELVKPWFPDVRVAAEIEAETPHMKLVQHYSRSFAKSHFKDRDATGPWSADRKAVRRLWTWCRATIQKTTGTALVVTQKAIEEAIRTEHRVPPHIDLGHHNAIAGRDTWGTVSTLISVGRTLPPPEAAEAVAMALSGQWLDPACLPTDAKGSRWYVAAAHPVADRKGNTITLTREHHPHPLAEAARAAICEDELVQVIGRCRGVNRTETDPVVVHVLADLPLPVPMDEFRTWERPGMDAAMLAEGCWTASAEDAARLWPEIIRTPMTLRNDRRSQSVLFSYNTIPYQNYTHCTYQRPGPRQRPVAAVFDRRLIPDPVQWLVERLGPVRVLFLDADAAMPRKTRRKAAKALPEAVEIEAPAPDALPEAVEISTSEAPRDPTWDLDDSPPDAPPQPFEGGTLPATERQKVRRRLRELGWTHADAAEAVGLSRPQFTNVLTGTFGLSRDAAARLAAFMNRPPDVPTQPDLNL